jgi:hypothetical protein
MDKGWRKDGFSGGGTQAALTVMKKHECGTKQKQSLA